MTNGGDITGLIPDPATGHTWADVALWVLDHNSLVWAVVAIIVVLFVKDFAANVGAITHAFDRWHERRVGRAAVTRERMLAYRRLDAEIGVEERRLIGPEERRLGDGAKGR